MVIPTTGETLIITALIAAGFPGSVTGALLVALPAVSLHSMVMVGRALSWRVIVSSLGALVVCSLAAGALLTRFGS